MNARNAATRSASTSFWSVVVAFGGPLLLVAFSSQIRADETKPKGNAAAKNVQIRGRVVDTKGRSVPKADVRAIGSFRFRQSLKSGGGGKFRLNVPAKIAQSLRFLARHDGLVGYERLPYREYRAGTIREVTVTLGSPRRIPVTVRDEVNKPIPGAWVAALADYRVVAEAKTNAAGKAELLAPADVPLMNVFARKRRVGLDYVSFRRKGAPASNPNLLPQDHAKSITLTLNGTRRVTIRVVDGKGGPMNDIQIHPWLFLKPERGRMLNISGVERFFANTDETGEAVFDTIPIDNQRKLILNAYAPEYYSLQRAEIDAGPGPAEATITLLPLVTVTGSVLHADGSPAKDVPVLASGAGYGMNRFRGKTRTGADGTFQFRVYPNMYYHFVAGNEDFASPGFNVVVLRKPPEKKIKLVLGDAVHIHGRVTVGPDKKPAARQHIMLMQRDVRDHFKLPKNERLPNPEDSRTAITAYISRNVQTDKDGRFEFFVGPGRYYIIGPRSVKPPNFEITKQKSHEVNLHSALPSTGRITGRVVLKGKPARGVAKVKIKGVPLKSGMAYLEAVTRKNGRFEATRGLSEMVVHARSAEGKLAGITKIKATDEKVAISIGPTASASGRLIDKATGKPIADAHLRCGHRITDTDGTFSLWFGDVTRTGVEGEFHLKGLVPGVEYQIWQATKLGPEGRPLRSRTVHKLTPKSAKAMKLGDVEGTTPE